MSEVVFMAGIVPVISCVEIIIAGWIHDRWHSKNPHFWCYICLLMWLVASWQRYISSRKDSN